MTITLLTSLVVVTEVGAVGTIAVLILTTTDGFEYPITLRASTLNWYVLPDVKPLTVIYRVVTSLLITAQIPAA